MHWFMQGAYCHYVCAWPRHHTVTTYVHGLDTILSIYMCMAYTPYCHYIRAWARLTVTMYAHGLDIMISACTEDR